MKAFEIFAGGDAFHMTVDVPPEREPLWAAAFGVDRLDGLFDMTPVDRARPVLDAAIRRFGEDPDALRPLLASGAPGGLFLERSALVRMRDRLIAVQGTISGAVPVTGDA